MPAACLPTSAQDQTLGWQTHSLPRRCCGLVGGRCRGPRGKRLSPPGRAPPSPGSCQPLRWSAVLPSPALPAGSIPAFCAPSGSEEAYPEGRYRSWDFAAGRCSLGEFNPSLREDGGLPPSGAARTPKRHFTSLRKFPSDSRAS